MHTYIHTYIQAAHFAPRFIAPWTTTPSSGRCSRFASHRGHMHVCMFKRVCVCQLFEDVQTMKPNSSRSQSSEIFVVCLKYTAPHKIDPKLLDPNHVFKADTPIPCATLTYPSLP